MRNSKKIALLLIVFIAGVWIVVAQRDRWQGTNDLPDAAAELRRVVMSQQQADSLLVEGEIRLYDEKDPGTVIESMPFRSYRKGQSFYSSFGPLITVADDQWMIQVDSLSQRIIVQQPDPATQSMMTSPQAGIQMLEKIWQDTSVFKVIMKISEKNRQRTIDITSEMNPEMRSASLTYDAASARVLKAEIRWKKDLTDIAGNDTWISRISYRNKPGFAMDITGIIKNIVELKDGQLVLSSGYEGFELVKADNNVNSAENTDK